MADYNTNKASYTKRKLTVTTWVRLDELSVKSTKLIPIIARQLHIPDTASVTIVPETGGCSIKFEHTIINPEHDEEESKHQGWFAYESKTQY